jgi:hypothetical protein
LLKVHLLIAYPGFLHKTPTFRGSADARSVSPVPASLSPSVGASTAVELQIAEAHEATPDVAVIAGKKLGSNLLALLERPLLLLLFIRAKAQVIRGCFLTADLLEAEA